jgi:hypothetical protein
LRQSGGPNAPGFNVAAAFAGFVAVALGAAFDGFVGVALAAPFLEDLAFAGLAFACFVVLAFLVGSGTARRYRAFRSFAPPRCARSRPEENELGDHASTPLS